MTKQTRSEKTKKWLGGLALAAVAFACGGKAYAGAGSPSYLNIDVTINASLSVAVNGVNSSTQTALSWNGTANQEFTSGTQASSATVTDDSGVAEKWYLSGSTNSVDTTGGGNSWTLATSTSPSLPMQNQYALQAVFGSSNTIASSGGTGAGGCPINGAADWQNGTSAPPLSGVPAQYTNTQFADANLNYHGGQYVPDLGTGATSKESGDLAAGYGARTLCWRLIMPNGTTTTDNQNIQLVVTAGE